MIKILPALFCGLWHPFSRWFSLFGVSNWGFLQCFDTVGWATGRTSSLSETAPIVHRDSVLVEPPSQELLRKLECGPMPNVMVALPKIGVQCRKVWLMLTTWLPCSNTAKTRKLLKLAGVPQTAGSISAASRPKFTILWGHLEEILLLNKFFPIVDTCHSCKDIARQSCTMVRRWRLFGDFLCPAFPASRVQHVSDLRAKLALRPHHVWKYGRHPISDRWD